ncbi:MAG: SH3 domain-containing protein [Lachnospiraceae bacterium]|nr:SH3 domain-containing protein [Lachnospiraceae bacterium]
MQRNILKTTLICCVALLLTCIPTNSLYAAEDAIETSINLEESVSGTYYVNAEHGLNMRNAPTTDADVITLLPYKAEIIVTGAATDNWYQIEYSNQSGYVAADYVTKSSASNPDTEDKDTPIAETPDTETPESTLPPENATKDMADTFGITPLLSALIAAIIIMVILAMFTAYSFLKKGNEEYDEEENSDEEYDGDDNSNEEYGDYNSTYDDQYDDEEYYDD